ncbi:hypothetical protein ACUH7Y_11725 [Clostridium beijerinckii]|uniref:Uncharacterized protein n=1 Tax=Clostridium beijerinckii TaxID=1520 RepID=A0A7X9SNR1_CLOBE|nr:hypothetical protein [Clostridium beijerinckii]NMF05245.1 hypothetical protein [Clostridium beijerinckii]
MRKNSVLVIILLCLLLGIFKPIDAYAANNFKEGVYKALNLNFSPDNTYFIQNLSNKDSIHVFIFDENQLEIQSIQLDPTPRRYNLVPLKPEYRIAIVGNGEGYIDVG